ncbi:MAG: DUF4859 domain-containing protein [Muribaculaceae bacterium]|nr:DUF4859 domain-containing protein [Muribaculaceae bacterium]
MNKHITLCVLVAGALLTGATSCEHDYADSSKIHVYGPDENPPVKADPAVTATRSYEMQAGDNAPVTLDVYDYEEMIQAAFGVSAQEVIAKLGSEYVVYPINPNRSVWVKADSNTGDKYGWYLNKNANVCGSEDENIYGKLVFNAEQHRFEFYLDPNGGGNVPMEMGFAKVGPNYNTHVRFIMSVTAYDKSYVFRDITIPAGDYAAYEWDWSDFAENIEYVFGMNVAQFQAAIEDGTMGTFMIDHATNAFIWDGQSTANNGGYWCGGDGSIMGWGDGCVYYIEPWFDPEYDEHCYGIGRYPGVPSGAQYLIKFGAALQADHSKALSYILNATFD